MARAPQRSQLADVDTMETVTGGPMVQSAADGLAAGQARMERIRREEEERKAAEAARLAALDGAETADDARAERRVTRATRKPFGTTTQKLFLTPRHGYHRHWFNDNPGRIEEALAAGYEHVLDLQGAPINRVVGRVDNGGGLRAYAMEIPAEWYQEDMRLQQEIVDKNAAGIKRGDLYGFDQSYLSSRTKVTDNSR